MIRLTRLNRVPMVLNSDLIEHIDVTPDTVITLTTGQILRVRETAEEVIRRIIDYRRQIFGPDGLPSDLGDVFSDENGARLEPVERSGPGPKPALCAPAVCPPESRLAGDSEPRN